MLRGSLKLAGSWDRSQSMNEASCTAFLYALGSEPMEPELGIVLF